MIVLNHENIPSRKALLAFCSSQTSAFFLRIRANLLPGRDSYHGLLGAASVLNSLESETVAVYAPKTSPVVVAA